MILKFSNIFRSSSDESTLYLSEVGERERRGLRRSDLFCCVVIRAGMDLAIGVCADSGLGFGVDDVPFSISFELGFAWSLVAELSPYVLACAGVARFLEAPKGYALKRGFFLDGAKETPLLIGVLTTVEWEEEAVGCWWTVVDVVSTKLGLARC